MSSFKEVDGDLIKLALEGKFDVIAHGCNCFCSMGAGIALPMAQTFGCNNFRWEKASFKGNINKLGMIDHEPRWVNDGIAYDVLLGQTPNLRVVNCYTQFYPGPDLSYGALGLCLRKMGHIFKGKHIGLPEIGCGIAGGEWNTVKGLIKKYLKECDVTIVHFKPEENDGTSSEIREADNGDGGKQQ